MAAPRIDCFDKPGKGGEVVQSAFSIDDLTQHFLLDQDGLLVTARGML
ncbi:MAG: hypothetical protein Q8M07_27385 [Prosthecobacter sp.]|nr:hypothetical protein [Prosthecobacter sp.]